MLCKRCGKEIENSAKFCPYCGSMQTATEHNPQIAQARPGSARRRNQNSLVIIIVSLVLIVAGILIFCGAKWVMPLVNGRSKKPSETHATDSIASSEAEDESNVESAPPTTAPIDEMEVAPPALIKETHDDGGRIYTISYQYYEDGTLFSKSQLSDSSFFNEVYDENGWLVLDESYTEADNSGEYREIVYTSNGQLLYCIFCNKDGTEYSRESYIENYTGETYSVIIPGWYDSRSYRTNHVNDERGNPIEQTSYYNGEFSDRTFYTYDDNNKLTSLRQEGDVVQNVEYRIEQTYDDQDRVVDEYDYTKYLNEEQLSNEWHYQYYSDYYICDSTGYAFEWSHIITTYNMQDAPLQVDEYSMDGTLSAQTLYTYDDNGKPLQIDNIYGLDSTPYGCTEEYQYDAFGNVTRSSFTHYGFPETDGETSLNGTNVTTYQYTYSESDLLMKSEKFDDTGAVLETILYEYETE